MSLIKLTLTCVLFYILYGYDFVWYPLVGPIAKIIISLTVAWFISRRLTRNYVCKKLLPTVNAQHKGVLVTGCDSGLGYRAVLELNKKGFFVFAGCLKANSSEARELVKKAQNPSKVLCVQLDVTSDDEVAAAYSKVVETLNDDKYDVKQLYAVINNAGIAIPSLVEFGGTGDQEIYWKHLAVNTFGAIRVTKAFLPLLRKEKESRVVNVSSMASRTNLEGMNPYAVSKAATSKFTEGLRDELSTFGVKAIGVEPWFFKTQITNSDHLTRGLNSAFEASNDHVRSIYREKLDQIISITRRMMNNPNIVSEDTHRVIDTLVDAVTIAEPDAVYRVLPSDFFTLPIWLITDGLPWELIHSSRKLTQSSVF